MFILKNGDCVALRFQEWVQTDIGILSHFRPVCGNGNNSFPKDYIKCLYFAENILGMFVFTFHIDLNILRIRY